MSLLLLRVWIVVTGRVSARRDEHGQTTAEYALVIIGVAAVASLLVAWATKSKAVTELFDSVIDKITP
jgi:Flp pilus assembly pilin Flp